jgi:hypothetical protein
MVAIVDPLIMGVTSNPMLKLIVDEALANLEQVAESLKRDKDHRAGCQPRDAAGCSRVRSRGDISGRGSLKNCLFRIDPLTWYSWGCCCTKPAILWPLYQKPTGSRANDWQSWNGRMKSKPLVHRESTAWRMERLLNSPKRQVLRKYSEPGLRILSSIGLIYKGTGKLRASPNEYELGLFSYPAI